MNIRWDILVHWPYPANIYLLKVNYKNTKKKCEICSKLTIEIPELHHWCLSDVFIVNLQHVSHNFFSVSIIDFEQVNARWISTSSNDLDDEKEIKLMVQRKRNVENIKIGYRRIMDTIIK